MLSSPSPRFIMFASNVGLGSSPLKPLPQSPFKNVCVAPNESVGTEESSHTLSASAFSNNQDESMAVGVRRKSACDSEARRGRTLVKKELPGHHRLESSTRHKSTESVSSDTLDKSSPADAVLTQLVKPPSARQGDSKTIQRPCTPSSTYSTIISSTDSSPLWQRRSRSSRSSRSVDIRPLSLTQSNGYTDIVSVREHLINSIFATKPSITALTTGRNRRRSTSLDSVTRKEPSEPIMKSRLSTFLGLRKKKSIIGNDTITDSVSPATKHVEHSHESLSEESIRDKQHLRIIEEHQEKTNRLRVSCDEIIPSPPPKDTQDPKTTVTISSSHDSILSPKGRFPISTTPRDAVWTPKRNSAHHTPVKLSGNSPLPLSLKPECRTPAEPKADQDDTAALVSDDAPILPDRSTSRPATTHSIRRKPLAAHARTSVEPDITVEEPIDTLRSSPPSQIIDLVGIPDSPFPPTHLPSGNPWPFPPSAPAIPFSSHSAQPIIDIQLHCDHRKFVESVNKYYQIDCVICHDNPSSLTSTYHRDSSSRGTRNHSTSHIRNFSRNQSKGAMADSRSRSSSIQQRPGSSIRLPEADSRSISRERGLSRERNQSIESHSRGRRRSIEPKFDPQASKWACCNCNLRICRPCVKAISCGADWRRYGSKKDLQAFLTWRMEHGLNHVLKNNEKVEEDEAARVVLQESYMLPARDLGSRLSTIIGSEAGGSVDKARSSGIHT